MATPLSCESDTSDGNVADSGGIERDSDVVTMPEQYPLDVLWYDMGYGNGARMRRKCVIFNFWKFAGGDERKGTEKDKERIRKVFGEKLGFDVDVHENLEKEAMLETLKKLAGEDHSRSCCLCLFVLSHGRDDIICCSDNQQIQLSDVYGQFDPTNCKGLTNKPKLFFIQACRGGEKDTGVQYDGTVDSDAWSFTRTVPRYADFFVFYATCPGVLSYRHPLEGSYFIQTLCEILERNHHVTDFMTMMTHVCHYVAEQDIPVSSAEVHKQMPNINSTLRKSLLFAAPAAKVTATQPSSAAQKCEHALARTTIKVHLMFMKPYWYCLEKHIGHWPAV
ncbi:caspase-7-like isoform X4 [Ornithodoros turicata]|uniref:caspase-7-like isoform X4 n=1 Tax=Ornithodoros turicata TaxID=34597 RepID=UPI003139C517